MDCLVAGANFLLKVRSLMPHSVYWSIPHAFVLADKVGPLIVL